MFIGDTIKRLRKEKKITQAKLARSIGVKQPAISTWEACVCNPSLRHTIAIAQYFGVRLGKLLGQA